MAVDNSRMAQDSSSGVNPIVIGIAVLVGLALLLLAAPAVILGLGIWGAVTLNRKSRTREAVAVMFGSVVLAVAAGFGVYAMVSNSDEPESAEQVDARGGENETVRTQPDRSESTFTVPSLVGDNLGTAMDQHSNIRFAWHDLAPSLIRSREGERGRAVLVADNWRIVAQCDKGRTLPEDTDVTIGVVKDDEVTQLDAATILGGGYNVLLGCR